jgi:transcriptional regulator with XRE-family HTH domain
MMAGDMAARVEASEDAWRNVAARVKKRRLSAEIDTDQNTLARQAGVSPSTISSLERAKATAYEARSLIRVSRALRWEDDGIERILRGEEPVTLGPEGALNLAEEEITTLREEQVRMRALVERIAKHLGLDP